jgi:phage major head subunit gpT-like protein
MKTVLSSTQVRHAILNGVSGAELPSWVAGLIQTGMPVQSSSASETYADIFTAPTLREWIGPRAAKQLGEFEFTIRNKKYEATIDIPLDWYDYDKLGLIDDRVASLGQRSTQHWMSLLGALIIAGETTACYDGELFFDTDHPTGKDSGTTMSNDISVDISALPVATHGSTTEPSVAEAAGALRKAMEKIRSFTDDQGEPMNEGVENFLVLCPPSFEGPLTAAVSGQQLPVTDGVIESLRGTNRRFRVEGTQRLASWTTKFAVFALDAMARPFIFQQVGEPKVTKKAEGSDYEHDTDRHQYGIKAVRGVGYNAWQSGCLVTLA